MEVLYRRSMHKQWMDREDKRRYFVVGSVFIEVVLPLFRQRLQTEYTSKGLSSLQAFINSQPVKHILFHLRRRNTYCCTDQANCINNPALPLNYPQWNLLYWENPAPGRHNCHCIYTAKHLSVDDLDITLSSLILLNCCNLQPVEDNAISSLRQYKNNYLSHNTKGEITQTDYNTLRTDLKSFVLQLDPSKQDDLIRLENRPLDDSLCTNYNTSLLDLHQQVHEMNTSVQTGFDRIQTVFDRIERLLTRQDRGVQESIPQVHEPDIVENTSPNQQLPGVPEQIDDPDLQPSTSRAGARRPYDGLGQNIFQLHHQINLKSVVNVDWIGSITGGVMMDDGRLVVCLSDLWRLLICNKDGSEANFIQLQYSPRQVTAVNTTTVAVTLIGSRCIEVYDINNKHKLKSIPIPRACWDITTINNKLVVGCEDNSLLMIDHQTGEVVQTIDTDCRPTRVHAAGNRIFYGDNYHYNRTLYCCSYTDDNVTTTTLPSQPSKITSLQDGSLYAVCEDGSVQHVSSDGEHYQLVTTRGLKGLGRCYGVSYNSNQKKLMTCSSQTKIVQIFNEM